MPMNTTAYSVGDLARLSFSVASTANVPTMTEVTVVVVPPSTSGLPKFIVRGHPDGSASSTALYSPTVGSWVCDYLIQTPGRHVYGFESSGTITATTEGAFAVRQRRATT